MAKQLTKDNPARIKRDLSIAADRLQGATYRELAKKYDISTATISAVLNDAEIRDVLKQGTNQIVSLVPIALDNYYQILSNPKHPDFYKASKDCLQNVGIIASHTGGNVYIDKMIQINDAPKPEDIARIRGLLSARSQADLNQEPI